MFQYVPNELLLVIGQERLHINAILVHGGRTNVWLKIKWCSKEILVTTRVHSLVMCCHKAKNVPHYDPLFTYLTGHTSPCAARYALSWLDAYSGPTANGGWPGTSTGAARSALN